MTVASDLDVLLIEDNPGDARLVEELLAEGADRDGVAGVSDLEHVGSLEAGLTRLDEDEFDVVLLDLGLPESTGLDTLETVREHAQAVPIVVLTGLDDARVGGQAVQQGAQEYLLKDELAPPLLRRSIQHAIDRKQFERTQTALHAASRELIGAESRVDVSRLAVDTAVEVFDLPGVGIYLFDDSANVLRPAAYTDYLESIFGELPSFGPADTSITWQAFIREETIQLEDVASSEHLHREDTPIESGIWIPLGEHGVLAIVSEETERFDGRINLLADHLAATVEATLDRVEREESLRDHERELAAQNRRLESLNRTNELIREIDQALVQARTREAIEQAVCDLLTREDRFAFAWIGGPADDGGIEPRTRGGDDGGYLEAVALAPDAGVPPPSAATLEADEVTLAPNVAADLRGAPWRKAALARDLQSAISVPLVYDDISYGVLTVYATEPGTFDDRLADVFGELGETIANAMNAVETRRALLTDTVVELELAIRDSEDLLGRLARAADCEVEYDGTVPQSDGTTRVFFSTRCCPADDVRTVVADAPAVGDLELISEADGEGSGRNRFEATVPGTTIPLVIVGSGAVVRSIDVVDDVVRAVVELPESTDVRTFVDRLEESYPETELLARRDRERAGPDAGSSRAVLTEQLTDRQLEAIQTAYLSGYFEWPRERTGEEVAESLGITQPTLNAHLRAAERKLCEVLFGGEGPPAE